MNSKSKISLSLFALITIFSSFKIESQSTKSGLLENSRVQSKIPDLSRPKSKIRFALRHPGVIDPNTKQPSCPCPSCKLPDCPCPLGMCIRFGIVAASDPLRGEEIVLKSLGELGTADIGLIDDNHLLIAFDQVTGYDNSSGEKIVEIDADYTLATPISLSLGVNSIKLNAGTYNVAFDGCPNGYIIVNCQTN